MLPNSLTRVLPSPGYVLPPHLCRFAVRIAALHRLEAFLGPRSGHLRACAPPSGSCLPLAPQSTQRLTLTAASPPHSKPLVQDCSPVVHRLRFPASAKARLTRRGLTFRRKPQGFGACGSHTCFATHASILTSVSRSCPSGQPCLSDRTLSYYAAVSSIRCHVLSENT